MTSGGSGGVQLRGPLVGAPILATPVTPEMHGFRRALIVDDVDSARRLLGMQLRRHGIESETAVDGVECIVAVLAAAGLPPATVARIAACTPAELTSPTMAWPVLTPTQQAALRERVGVVRLDAVRRRRVTACTHRGSLRGR